MYSYYVIFFLIDCIGGISNKKKTKNYNKNEIMK